MAQPRLELHALFSFAKYLSWADLQNRLFEAELQREVPPDDPSAARDHEWRWWGLMSYWYASLYVVVEAWDELQLTDPVVDRLLCHPRDYRALLRRYRNSVFHFQKSMLSDKVTDLFAAGTELIFCVQALHDEIVRSFRAHLRGLVYTAEQFEETRESFKGVVNWFPYTDSPQFDSAAQVLAEGRRLLAANPNEDSVAREDLEQTIAWAEELLRTGKSGWAVLREDILRQSGCLT